MQIIAIRSATPIIGSSIILTSVFIGIILLALSAGYYTGGIISSRLSRKQLVWTLFAYLIFAGLYYLFITFGVEQDLLVSVLTYTDSYVLTLFIVAVCLFLVPVFIASQTLPFLTELIPEQSKGKAAGQILFASTIGSFFGSVLTSIVLFEVWGVLLTSIVVAVSLLGIA